MGQMQGYDRPGWGDTHWLLLNIRDLIVGALRDPKAGEFPEFPLMPPVGKRSNKKKTNTGRSKIAAMLEGFKATAAMNRN